MLTKFKCVPVDIQQTGLYILHLLDGATSHANRDECWLSFCRALRTLETQGFEGVWACGKASVAPLFTIRQLRRPFQSLPTI